MNQRLKLWEASQWRNQELIKARLQYFDRLAPMLNDLLAGHPFLTRLAFYRLATGQSPSFDKLDTAAAEPDGPFGDHLRAMSSSCGIRRGCWPPCGRSS